MNTAQMQETEMKIGAIQRLLDAAVKRLIDPSALKPKRVPPPPQVSPQEPEAHGSKIRSDVVGTALSRLEDHLRSYPGNAEKILRLVNQEIALKSLGLSYMRVNELARVRAWLMWRKV